MSIINTVQEVLHRIRVKLYPNYLHNVEGAYIARTDSEASLNVPKICASLKDRGGYGGDFEDLVEGVGQFFDEAMYKLCDGFSINFGYFTMHPNIGGTFNSASEIHDHEKHKITFCFRTLPKLRRLVQFIEVDVEGIADTSSWIDEYFDVEEDSTNTVFIPGGQFIIHGHRIKAAGDDPSVGVYFVPVDDPSKAVKVGRLAENNPSKIIGIAPKTDYQRNRIEIRTQFEGSSTKFLKTVRCITSGFVLEEG